jgi:hypothetical protein
VLPRGPGPHLLTEFSSGAATHSSAPDLASLKRWAPALLRVPWLRALPPREESSGTAMCFSALDLASLPRWALALPRGPDLASPRGELQCCHVLHGPQRAMNHRNKEGPNCPQARSWARMYPKYDRVLPRRLQGVRIGRYSSVQQCNAGPTDHS